MSAQSDFVIAQAADLQGICCGTEHKETMIIAVSEVPLIRDHGPGNGLALGIDDSTRDPVCGKGYYKKEKQQSTP